jgi:uncharacterized protein
MNRVRLWCEFLLLFVGLIVVLVVVKVPFGPIPILLVGGGAVLVYLRRQPTFDRASLWRASGVRESVPSMLVGVAVGAVVLGGAVFLVDWESFFAMPREHPLLWLAVAILYPLVSVYPQELLYRAFLLHRYAPLFGTGRTAAFASAVVFGFAHLIYGNAISVVLTLIGGWMFARRYQRTRSLLAAGVEHALYGVLIFTIGLGDLFYHGATG